VARSLCHCCPLRGKLLNNSGISEAHCQCWTTEIQYAETLLERETEEIGLHKPWEQGCENCWTLIEVPQDATLHTFQLWWLWQCQISAYLSSHVWTKGSAESHRRRRQGPEIWWCYSGSTEVTGIRSHKLSRVSDGQYILSAYMFWGFPCSIWQQSELLANDFQHNIPSLRAQQTE